MLCLFWAQVALAQPTPGMARVDAAASGLSSLRSGQTTLTLALSAGVPFRVFTRDDPRRLVIDFRTVDWSGVRAEPLLSGQDAITGMRFGAYQPGWTRLVADLAAPFDVQDVSMRIDEASGSAVFSLALHPTSPEAFAARTGPPPGAVEAPLPPQAPVAEGAFVVVIDPGHGGIDPGAERDGVNEKSMMLSLAQRLRKALLRHDDVQVVLTRTGDRFLSLQSRLAVANRAEADLFVSLHADALSEGGAQGATVYTLSDAASDTASAHLAARHDRADVLSGVDLSGTDDEVAGVLLDLARQETEPRSEALAQALLRGLEAAGLPMNGRPLRRAGFSVLKSADIPSVLVEVGFLSNARDLDNIRDPEWRTRAAEALARAIMTWRADDARRAELLRR